MAFVDTPNIKFPRSSWNMRYTIGDMTKHGLLYPVDCIPTVAGDTFDIDLSALWRMSTPIVPIFGNIKLYYDAFFIPYRLLWENAKKFFGEIESPLDNNYDLQIPSLTVCAPLANAPYSFTSRLGKPIKGMDAGPTIGSTPLSILKERAYVLVWNEYYRPASLINSLNLNKGDFSGTVLGNAIGTYNYSININDNNIGYADDCFPVSKEFDLFTTSLLSPQNGPTVNIPLGEYANVVGSAQFHTVGKPYNLSFSNNGSFLSIGANGSLRSGNITADNIVTTADGELQESNLVADLTNATSASIIALRLAFQTQRFFERQSFAFRYFDFLKVHFGTAPTSLVLQRPEHLGRIVKSINVQDIYSTAGFTEDNATVLGEVGGFSATGFKKQKLLRYTALEPGYILIVCFTRFEQLYSQGFLKEDRRLTLYEQYLPEFVHVGDEAVEQGELFCSNSFGTQKLTFGYNERYYDLHFRPSRVHGLMNPQFENSMSYWSVANDFPSPPSLNRDFIFEDRAPLVRALKTGEAGPDYISYTAINIKRTSPFPVNSIPGLVDHVGNF